MEFNIAVKPAYVSSQIISGPHSASLTHDEHVTESSIGNDNSEDNKADDFLTNEYFVQLLGITYLA